MLPVKMHTLFNNKKAIHLVIRLWTVVILFFAAYHAYELGFTDKYKPIKDISRMGSDKLRLLYVNTGFSALPYLNLTNICLATSFIITPAVLFVFLFTPRVMTVSRSGIFLAYSSLFFLTIFNVLAVDTPINYYASRYFLPALFPVLFLTFCSILANIRSKMIVTALISILCIVMLLFNMKHDYALYGKQAYPNRFAVIKELGKYIPPQSYVFLHVSNQLRCLLLPNLRLMDDLNVISLNSTDDKEPVQILEQPQLMRQIFNNYALQLNISDFYIISSSPYGFNASATLTFKDALQPATIEYPRTLNNIVHRLYVYHIQGFGNYLFNTMKILNLARHSDLDVIGYPSDGVWSNGSIEIKKIEYLVKPEDRYIVVNTAGKYHTIARQYNLPAAVVSLAVNGKTAKMIKNIEERYYFKLDKSMPKIISLTVHSSTFVPKNAGINNDERALGIDVTSFQVE